MTPDITASRRRGRPRKGILPPTRKQLLDEARTDALILSILGRSGAKMHRDCGSRSTLAHAPYAHLSHTDPADAVRWFCVQTHPGQESRAAFELRQQGFTVFCPVHITERHRRPVARPSLSGYLFVALDPDRSRWRHIPYTYGVARLFMANDLRPAPARRGDVERLITATEAHLAERNPMLAALPKVEPGATGQVADGPFTSFHCVVGEQQGDGRYKVEVSIFGRSSPVFLERGQFRLDGGRAA